MPTPQALQAANISDLTKATLPQLNRLRYTDIAPTLQQYLAMPHLFQQNRIEYRGGRSIQWDVNVADPEAAQNVALGATDGAVGFEDTFQQASVDWRGSSAQYGYPIALDDMNSGDSVIVNLRQARRHGALKDLTYLMEANWFGPPVSATDNLTPWGLNTWVVKNATAGFNGGLPTGYSTIGGLSPTTYPGWNNYTAPYTNITKSDLVRALRLAARKTNFMAPVQGIPTTDTGHDWQYYTTLTVVQAMEELLEAQNDDLGQDIASQDNKVMFLSKPMHWVPYLDADTTNPVYGVNYGSFKTAVLQGWWLRETYIRNYPNQHTVQAWFLDLIYQILCFDRRSQFVVSNGTTYPS